jgi:hypothetical protein
MQAGAHALPQVASGASSSGSSRPRGRVRTRGRRFSATGAAGRLGGGAGLLGHGRWQPARPRASGSAAGAACTRCHAGATRARARTAPARRATGASIAVHQKWFFHSRRAANTETGSVASCGAARAPRPPRRVRAAQEGVDLAFEAQRDRQRGLPGRAQRLAQRCARPRGIGRVHGGGEAQVGQRVFVGAAHLRVVRAGRPGAPATGVHLCRRAFEQRPQPPRTACHRRTAGAPAHRRAAGRRCGRRCGQAHRSPRTAGPAPRCVAIVQRLARLRHGLAAPGRTRALQAGRSSSTPPT